MNDAISLVEIWRGPFLESVHRGHGVVCDASGQVVEAWGDPTKTILPRSSCKMIQALPLVESGAADAIGLSDRHLALACASHQGATIHSDLVTSWLSHIDQSDDDLRCGPQFPRDRDVGNEMIRTYGSPCQYHNNCSGKHTGFLTLKKHLNAGPDYIEPDHPVQKMVREAFEDVTNQPSPGFGIDGCSAPNFATTMQGLGRAMAWFASADPESSATRERAAGRLVNAMRTHPELVAGEGRACTELMRAMNGKVVLKTGAEGVYVAILPEQKLGVAVKIEDGTTRAAECAIASILVRLGALNPDHPATLMRRNAPILNFRGVEAAWIRPAEGVF